jgi:puromycin-sensitive aminopeptidase
MKDPGSVAKRSRAPHRLDGDVAPVAYDLGLDVDPVRGPDYTGEATIRLQLEKPRRQIVLHAAELRIVRARVESSEGSAAAQVTLDATRQTATFALPRPVGPGDVTLRISFAGRLRNDLRGLYAASADGQAYAFSQLEAAEARRFFPCFDEPSMKARFTLRVETRAELAVLSNSPIVRTEKLADNRKRVHFAETPRLSTYLIALAVGALERSRAVKLGKTEIRVWHAPGKGALVAFALEAARETLARLERWFALPYPYAKLDLVAVPDFEAGAMENAGAVFFRENLLLLDPKSATLAEKKRAAEVICHELAHMWYGDLVTMAWWDDLWLNEAFATWMAFEIVDQWKPEWKMWQDFQHHRAAALRLDALRHTHPIHTEVQTPAEATENFDLITYEKGASVVRMLERYLGPAVFRKGVRAYIRRHREGNAVAADLWRALSEAAGEEVEPIVRGWIDREGLPVLSLVRARSAGRSVLRLRQERFVAQPAADGRRDKGRAPGGRRSGRGSAEKWPIPWVGRIGGAKGRTKLVRKLVTASTDRIDLGRDEVRFVYGNADEGGFFRPLHDAKELAALTTHLSRIGVVERMGLVDHQWALARAGRAPLTSFLSLVDALGDEPEADVLLALRGPLAFLEDRLAPSLGAAALESFRDRVAARFGPALAELGWDPPPREPVDTRVRRGVLVSLLGDVAAWPPVLTVASKRFDAYLARRDAVDPNLVDAVVLLAARGGDAARFDAMLAAFEAATTPQERRRFLLALAEFRDERLVRRALSLCLGPRIPTQDMAIVMARLLGNPAARELSWEFTRKHWTRLRKRMPPMLATRLIEATPALGERHRKAVETFFREHPLPTGTRALEQALERFDLDAAFCRIARDDLARWLAESPA